MKILIDIGHPGQVHYFRNAIGILKKNGHEILIVARDREYVFDLLDTYKLPYINRGKGRNSIIGKFVYMLEADFKIFKIARKFRPDLFLSFSSPYAAQVSFLLKKPHIAINDTEHEDMMYSIFTYPFCTSILTPRSFQSDLGKKQIRFDNVVEGLYLNKDHFNPDNNIRELLKIETDQKFVFFRFSGFHAHHDIGQKGLDLDTKIKLIEKLSNEYRIFISSEDDLPEQFNKFKINIPVDKMHDVLANAHLFIGESATMASESCMLGTYSVYVNSSPITCNIKIQQEAGIAKYFNSSIGVLEYVTELIKDEDLKSKTKKKSIEMQKNFINPTYFLVWFIENYQESSSIMKNDPKYQYRFK